MFIVLILKEKRVYVVYMCMNYNMAIRERKRERNDTEDEKRKGG